MVWEVATATAAAVQYRTTQNYGIKGCCKCSALSEKDRGTFATSANNLSCHNFRHLCLTLLKGKREGENEMREDIIPPGRADLKPRLDASNVPCRKILVQNDKLPNARGTPARRRLTQLVQLRAIQSGMYLPSFLPSFLLKCRGWDDELPYLRAEFVELEVAWMKRRKQRRERFKCHPHNYHAITPPCHFGWDYRFWTVRDRLNGLIGLSLNDRKCCIIHLCSVGEDIPSSIG